MKFTKGSAGVKYPKHGTLHSRACAVAMVFTLFFAATGLAQAKGSALDLVRAARAQIGITVLYDPAYVEIDFPGGDIAIRKGVCTDVIVRALRRAKGYDLQAAMHTDIKLAPEHYPQHWDLATRGADAHIDHRRVANQMVYFQRKGYALPLETTSTNKKSLAQFKPGDIVAWNLDGKQLHIGIVSSKPPMIIHNIGSGTVEEDILFSYPIIGHYRIP